MRRLIGIKNISPWSHTTIKRSNYWNGPDLTWVRYRVISYMPPERQVT